MDNNNAIIKLNKTQINELLYHISKDNQRYGLVLKIVYIYGRNIGDVLRLKRKHITEDMIKFEVYDGTLDFIIHKDIESDLLNYVDGLAGEDYLFINVDNRVNVTNTNVYSNKINIYLKDYIKHLNKNGLCGWHCPLLVCTDFKILRGQHLIIDGCPLKTLQELFHVKNVASIKNMIKYKDLMKLRFECDSLSKVFDGFTDLNVFYDSDFVETELFTVSTTDGYSTIIEYNPYSDSFSIVVGDDVLSDMVNGLDVSVFKGLSCLSSGEYKFVDGFRIVKN